MGGETVCLSIKLFSILSYLDIADSSSNFYSGKGQTKIRTQFHRQPPSATLLRSTRRTHTHTFPHRFYCFAGPDGGPECAGKEKGHVYNPVPEEVETELRRFLAPYNREFYEKVGRDFGWREA